MDADEKALQPIPRRMFVLAFVAGGICALGLATAAWFAEQRATPTEAPEAAATETGGALDPTVREELEALDRTRDGSSWLQPEREPPSVPTAPSP